MSRSCRLESQRMLCTLAQREGSSFLTLCSVHCTVQGAYLELCCLSADTPRQQKFAALTRRSACLRLKDASACLLCGLGFAAGGAVAKEG